MLSKHRARLGALVMSALVLGVLFLAEGRGLSATVLAERASKAQQSWLQEVESGAVLHVVDSVYEAGAFDDDGSGFALPESYTQELWLQYAPGGPAHFCARVLSGESVIQHSFYDRSADELVTVDDRTGAVRRIAGGVYKDITAFRASIERGSISSSEISGGRLIEGDGSLGRDADSVSITTGPDDLNISVPVEQVTGESSDSEATAVVGLEKKLYFDRETGEQFASEKRLLIDGGEPLLTYRRARTVTIEASFPACER